MFVKLETLKLTDTDIPKEELHLRLLLGKHKTFPSTSISVSVIGITLELIQE